MARQTQIFTALPDLLEAGAEIQGIWTVLTHAMGDEWWSEILDENRHPHVQHDEHGYDTVQKFFGDSVEESRDAALEAVRRLVQERGGRIVEVQSE